MSDQIDQHDLQPLAPTRVSALRRGRSTLEDRLLLTRLRRRRLIRQIEAHTQRVLLCYVSEDPPIEQEDVLYLNALLQRVEPGASVTLLLNSPGGDVDAAERLQHMLRESASPPGLEQPGDVEIVVPNRAKSAATIMVLGADRVTMSDASELGPIDPQVEIQNGYYSVAAWLTAYDHAERRCQEHPENPAFAAVFQSFNPVIVEMLRFAESRAQNLAEDLAKRADGWNYTKVATHLMDTKIFPSHGQMIDWQAAQDIGLKNVRYMARTDPLWDMYWKLYLALRSVAGDQKKAFESRHVTRLVRIPQAHRSASASGADKE